ncbi:hypothetical protein T03_7009 [Trichinella britovi]|uniref:Uncharacterized protein n=1 Tax=Trichinella britovi TaxID=45882 RepID=A0A0V0ZGQ3_TRIBR|nr:hypothetical protein T03_7009 [Trichinella britovi]
MFTSFGSKFCITNIRKYLQLDRTVFGAVTFPTDFAESVEQRSFKS